MSAASPFINLSKTLSPAFFNWPTFTTAPMSLSTVISFAISESVIFLADATGIIESSDDLAITLVSLDCSPLQFINLAALSDPVYIFSGTPFILLIVSPTPVDLSFNNKELSSVAKVATSAISCNWVPLPTIRPYSDASLTSFVNLVFCLGSIAPAKAILKLFIKLPDGPRLPFISAIKGTLVLFLICAVGPNIVLPYCAKDFSPNNPWYSFLIGTGITRIKSFCAPVTASKKTLGA